MVDSVRGAITWCNRKCLHLTLMTVLTNTIFILPAMAQSRFGVGTKPNSPSVLAKLPRFEVASIKPVRMSDPAPLGIGFYVFAGGRAVASRCPLQYLLTLAFNVENFQIKGGPNWIDTNRYDIEAKPPASSPASKLDPPDFRSPPDDEERQMLLALLIDRFGLKFHRATEAGTVYLLERGSGPLRLDAPKDHGIMPWFGEVGGGRVMDGEGIGGQNISMSLLALRLSGYLERPVIDRTGLDGAFDFEVHTGNDDPDADIVSSILISIREIGLKLESAKGPVNKIVIDHLNEMPSQN